MAPMVSRFRCPWAPWTEDADHLALCDGGGASGGSAVSGTSSRNTRCPPRVSPLAMRRGFIGEGTHPDPVIFAFRPLAWGYIGLGEPVLHLLKHGLGLVFVFKGPHLDLI